MVHAEEEQPSLITVTNVQLRDLPVTLQEIKNAVLDLATAIQYQEQGLDPPQLQPQLQPQMQATMQTPLQALSAMTEEQQAHMHAVVLQKIAESIVHAKLLQGNMAN